MIEGAKFELILKYITKIKIEAFGIMGKFTTNNNL